MKKLFALMLAVCMLLSLCACGDNGNNGDDGTTTNAPTTTTNAPTTTATNAKVSIAGHYVLCGIDEDGEHMDEAMLKQYGLVDTTYLDLKDDGSGIWMMEGDELPINYDEIKIYNPENPTEFYHYEIKDGKLVLDLGEGMIFYYRLAS